MAQSTLTDLAIRALPCPEMGQKTYWDQNMAGFGVRVSQGGTKSFVVVYGAQRSRRTIGRFPIISLKEARGEAKKLMASITLGTISTQVAPSFSEAVDRFLRTSSQKNRPKTVLEYRRILKRHFDFPRKKLDEVSRPDIQTRLDRLSKTPSEQRYAFIVARTFFNWALREQHIDKSPIALMRPPSRAISRERILSEAELREVFQKAEFQLWPYGAIVKLLVLTGQRRGEIGMLRWSWINLDEQVISIPPEFTKNRQAHTFPFGKNTSRILQALPRQEDIVFPGATDGAAFFNGWSKCKKRLDSTLENVDPYVIHDLRRTYSSAMAKLGTPIHVTEKLLNHISGTISGIAAVYNRHSYTDEMRSAVLRYEKYISHLLA